MGPLGREIVEEPSPQPAVVFEEHNVELSIVVPAFNEADRIAPRLPVMLSYLERCRWSVELIIVDDGSTDATAEIVRAAFEGRGDATLITYRPNRGKGYAVRTGVLAAQGKFVAYLDADLATPFDALDAAVPLLEEGEDLVFGSRDVRDNLVSKRQPRHRRAAALVVRNLRKAIVGLHHVSDTQCGFKVFRKDALRPIFDRLVVDRFLFDIEILYLADRAGLKLRELAVPWADVEGSKVRPLPVAIELARDLALIRWVHRRRFDYER